MYDKNLRKYKVAKMKNLLFFISVVVIFCCCSKEKLNGSSGGSLIPKPIYDTFNLRVALSDWHFDQWLLLFESDSAYFTILPRFNTFPGLAGKADSIKADNILSVKIKMGTGVLQVDNSISSRPFSYDLTNAPAGGANNTIIIHWWDARPDFQVVDSVDLRLKFLK